jgi:hypothetical protein
MSLKIGAGIIFFGVTEILIGGVTLLTVGGSALTGTSQKPLEVLVFVLVAAAISLGIGIGLLRYNLTSYHLLLFFSKVIILSKILSFFHIIYLNGALETRVPTNMKNAISIIYHAGLIWYLSRTGVRKLFGGRSNAASSIHIPYKDDIL